MHRVKAALLIVRYVVLPLLVFGIVIHFLLEDIRLFLGAVILIGGFLGIGYFRSRSRFRRLGFRVIHYGRDSVRYDELCGGQFRSIEFGGEMEGDSPHIIYLPSAAIWRDTAPEWAHDRRDEIIARLKSEFREPNYEYVGTPFAPPSPNSHNA